MNAGTARRRRRPPPPQSSHERWLVSYADFITLLFAFFTTMYAISTVDAQKMSKMVESMQTAFTSSGRPAALSTPPLGVDPDGLPGRAGPSAEVGLADALSAALGGEFVEVAIDQRGVVVSIREGGSFQTGSADLSAVARDVLRRLAATIAGRPNAVRVEGHTDDVPIRSGRFGSNWELSTARATAVVQFLVHEGGLRPDRLSAAGYGEFRGRAANDTDANRALNRRVDIVILNIETETQEEPA